MWLQLVGRIKEEFNGWHGLAVRGAARTIGESSW